LQRADSLGFTPQNYLSQKGWTSHVVFVLVLEMEAINPGLTG
jgi:hypothetical protein